MPVLQIRTVDSQSRPIYLDGEPVSIGRHPDNTIRISDDKASRYHCIIEPDESEGGFVVRDLGSRNGLKVNGERVADHHLSAGDIIRIGQTEFLIEIKPGPFSEEDDGANMVAGFSAREKKRTRGTRTPQPTPPWAVELEQVIDSLSSFEADQEELTLIYASGDRSDSIRGDSDGPLLLRQLLIISSRSRATDIHFEPKGERVHVRMRVDGQMVWICELPNRVGALAAGMVKTACQMKSASNEAVLDGHFAIRYPDRRVDVRVSFTPSMHGQKLVMRILDQRGVPRSLGEVGLLPYMEQRVRKVCDQDHGLLLVCGPTGSGKTTTLYNALREIDRQAHNVITIEDPVEYQIDNVTQIPINESRGNNFNTLLRSVLRQDPDVILLGEVRDEETARTAMQASMTGHVVFSTIHARDTISAVFRLLDLKVEPYLVANALDLILAQRLVRVLCKHCKRAVRVTPGQASRIGPLLSGKSHVKQVVGCKKCLRTGYWGRRAIFELLDFSDDLRDIVLNNPSIQAMKKNIAQGHFTTLGQFGWRLVAEGETTIDEIERVAGSR